MEEIFTWRKSQITSKSIIIMNIYNEYYLKLIFIPVFKSSGNFDLKITLRQSRKISKYQFLLLGMLYQVFALYARVIISTR